MLKILHLLLKAMLAKIKILVKNLKKIKDNLMLSLPILFTIMLLPGVSMLATSIIVSLFEQHNENLVVQERLLNNEVL